MGEKKSDGIRPKRDILPPQLMRAAFRRLRARKKGWSPEKDREYHDALFGSREFDPFSFAYPGYITIRRFADLATPFLKELRSVLDLGCGPAEITCELARRHPGVSFIGVDHSQAGIERARRHARFLGLSNIAFEIARIEEFLPDRPIDLVTMFDAFHHLKDPKQFVRRTGDSISRFARIIAVADVFDALTSTRHYRDAMTVEDALTILYEGIDTDFDRNVVLALVSALQNEKNDQDLAKLYPELKFFKIDQMNQFLTKLTQLLLAEESNLEVLKT